MRRRIVTLARKLPAIFKSCLGAFRGRQSDAGADSPNPRYTVPETLAGWFRVVEVDDVEQYAGSRFRRCFHHPPPDAPRPFVALVDADGEERTIGYIHYAKLDDVYLGGGMCIDERVFRRLPNERRDHLKQAGGIAEQMLRHTTASLANARAIFGYVGDKRAERVDLRAGFEHTGTEHLIVFWPRPLPVDEQRAIVARVARVGPF
jgi:hypothetical protein